jgi:hypothetical protein
MGNILAMAFAAPGNSGCWAGPQCARPPRLPGQNDFNPIGDKIQSKYIFNRRSPAVDSIQVMTAPPQAGGPPTPDG